MVAVMLDQCALRDLYAYYVVVHTRAIRRMGTLRL